MKNYKKFLMQILILIASITMVYVGTNVTIDILIQMNIKNAEFTHEWTYDDTCDLQSDLSMFCKKDSLKIDVVQENVATTNNKRNILVHINIKYRLKYFSIIEEKYDVNFYLN